MVTKTSSQVHTTGKNGQQAEIVSINPATGQPIDRVAICPPEAVPGLIQQARDAQANWGAWTLRQRLAALKPLAEVIVDAADEIASLLTAEQGKGGLEAYGEIFAVLDLFEYHRKIAPGLLATRTVRPKTGLMRGNEKVRVPYGVVGVISPWNFPFNLSLQPMLAALIAGNATILKPSEFTPLIGELIADLFQGAGLPENLVQVIQGYGDTGAALIAGGIDKLVFTGSVATGRKVAALAGQHLVPVTLELGGKDAAIVLEDADLDRAAQGIAWGANMNAGQACLAIERVYVVEAVADEFTRKIVEQFKALRVGPGTNPEIDITAITTPQQLAIIQEQVRDALAKGAHIACGGKPLPGDGLFFEPTVLTSVTDEMQVMQAETFGPVIAIQRVRDADEAVQRSNAVPFGLTGSLWTRGISRARALAARIEVGDIAINEHGAPAGHSEVEWGGVKASGYGRTRGPEGLLEMTALKHVSWPYFQTRREAHWFPNSAQGVNAVKLGIGLLFGTWRQKIAALRGK